MEQPKSKYIPSEAYLYFPKGDDFRAKDGQRMIFDGNTKFDEYESKMIAKFRAYLEKHAVTLKPMWNDNMILRFLYANGFKMEKTLSSIRTYTQWYETSLPVQADNLILHLLNSGIIYVHGRDHRFRPIIVFNVYKLDPKKVDIDLVRRALTYLFEYIIAEWMLPGQVENWVFICNVKGMSLGSIASQSVRNLFMYLQDNYKCRLHSIYIINASSSVYVPWNIVKKLLDDTTVQKVHFYKSQNIPDLYKHTNHEQVEQQYGGRAPNATQYWPPSLPSNNYFVSAEDAKALVSKQDYINLSSSGQLKNMRLNRSFVEDENDDEEIRPVPEKLLRRTSSQVLLAVSDPDMFLPSMDFSTADSNNNFGSLQQLNNSSTYKPKQIEKGIFREDSYREADFSEMCISEKVPVGCAMQLAKVSEGEFPEKCISESTPIVIQARNEVKSFPSAFISGISPKHASP